MSKHNHLEYEQQLNQSRQIWDAEAATFDDQPDHGLSDPAVHAAWANLFRKTLTSSNLNTLDIGCGTGSLSLLLSEMGCRVTGIDFSPEMIAIADAKAKAQHQPIQFQIMDAALPQLADQLFDVIVCRHLLWALPEPDQVLQGWVRLLKLEGQFLLIEGFWHTGAGLHSQQIIDVLPASLTDIVVHNLSDQADLWGGAVDDERYMIAAHLRP